MHGKKQYSVGLYNCWLHRDVAHIFPRHLGSATCGMGAAAHHVRFAATTEIRARLGSCALVDRT